MALNKKDTCLPQQAQKDSSTGNSPCAKMPEHAAKLNIEVAYATSEKQHIVSIWMDEKSTVLDAIVCSKICTLFPEIDLTKQKVGIFGKICQLTDYLKNHDRVEIYRPLRIDPKTARRAKAKKVS